MLKEKWNQNFYLEAFQFRDEFLFLCLTNVKLYQDTCSWKVFYVQNHPRTPSVCSFFLYMVFFFYTISFFGVLNSLNITSAMLFFFGGGEMVGFLKKFLLFFMKLKNIAHLLHTAFDHVVIAKTTETFQGKFWKIQKKI